MGGPGIPTLSPVGPHSVGHNQMAAIDGHSKAPSVGHTHCRIRGISAECLADGLLNVSHIVG